MLFFKPAIAVALASFSVSSLAQAPQFYIDRLNILTTETKNLIQPANSITVTSGPLAGVGQGPLAVIFDGCEAAIVRLNELLPQMQPDAPIVDPDAKPVAQACESFIDAQIELWTILSGKSWLMIDPFSRSKTALYARTLEGLVDGVLVGLIARIPSEASFIQGKATSISQTYTQAAQDFERPLPLIDGNTRVRRHARDITV